MLDRLYSVRLGNGWILLFGAQRDIAEQLAEHHKKHSPADRHRMDLLYRRAHAIPRITALDVMSITACA